MAGHFLRFILGAGLMAVPAAAQEPTPRFALPLACTYGEDCFIQNYVDRDPGPGWVDHACGSLTYDGDGGTDFRLRDYLDMERGYEVLAAADGMVRATRDGMPDVSIRETGVEAVRGREAGNGVVIEHGNGWTTQYSHLRRGSVAVRSGERVRVGQTLGLVGLSGRTEFPHVEFKVRLNDREVDPFVGAEHPHRCGEPKAPLWTPETEALLIYMPTGLLGAGFAAAAPQPEETRRGAGRLRAEVDDPDALVLWVDLFGVRADDQETFRLIAPDGSALLDRTRPIEAAKASWFAFAGLRRPASRWMPGPYRGVYELRRANDLIARAERSVTIRR